MNKFDKKDLVMRKQFCITPADTDMFGRLRLGALANYLIQSAIEAADRLGFGLQFLMEEQLFWVLNRMDIEILQQQNWKDEIEVETWPKTLAGILYVRDFVVRNGKGEIVAKATSGWLAVDLKTKRPKKIGHIINETFCALEDKKAFEELPSKLKPIEYGTTKELTTNYFDVDLNKHITSTRYIDWTMDCFDVDFHALHYPKKMACNYMKEIKLGHNLLLSKIQGSENCYGFGVYNKQTKRHSFACEIEFEKNKTT